MAINKAAIAVGLLGTAAAAAAVWLAVGRSASGPSMLSELDATHTLAAVELRNLDTLAGQGLEQLEQMPTLPTAIAVKRADIEKYAGGDPSKRETWTALGLDAERGLAIAVDKRVVVMRGDRGEPVPIFMARVTDQAKLQAGLAKAGITVVLGKIIGPVQELEIGGKTLWMGKRGDDTAVVPFSRSTAEDKALALRTAFEQFLRTDGPRLAEASNYKQVRKQAGNSTLFGWTDASGLVPLARGKETQADLAFFAGLFPYAALWLSDQTAVRVGASDAGKAILAEIGKPKRNPPRCARLIAKTGWAAGRVSVNLVDVVAGIGKLLPPSSPGEVRTAVGASTAMLGFLGVAWNEVTDAFSGHTCAAVDIAGLPAAMAGRGKQMPAWLATIGVVDAPKADAFVAKAIELAKGKGGVIVTEIKVGAAKGWLLSLGPVSVAAARIDDVLMLGPSVAALEAAIGRASADSLAATVAKDLLDGDVAWSIVFDVHAAITAGTSLAAAVGDPAAVSAAAAKLVAKLGNDRYAGMALTLDDHGALLHSEGDPLLRSSVAVVGPALATLAIPNFMRYQNRANETEARMSLNTIARQAVAYFPEIHGEAGGCQFPASTGPNPPQSCCQADSDKNGDKACDPEAFLAGPTWQALHFTYPQRSHFQYAFESSGSLDAAQFTARAYADFDCDGTFATFAIRGIGRPDSSGACSAQIVGSVETESGED
ncbi:MAG: hypothetical protein EXR77_13540 [Myxococcales bacterium]|nr:hypothetical protein [Myxococcales bacterium]